jgi:citrate lyase beta subunit
MSVFLFVPGDRPERFTKAVDSGADAAILDLEDAVAPERKQVARVAVREALIAGLRALVRVNPASTDLGRADIAMLAGLAPAAVLLPKAGGSRDVDIVRDALPEVDVIALIESVEGLRNAHEIAATSGVRGLAFGAFDMCAELGARPVPEVLAPLRSLVVVAARGAGVAAIDTPFLALEDEAGLAADARRSLDFGFDGKLAIHPKQVAPIRAVFTPSAEDLERARLIVAAAERGGVAVIGGAMVDAPIFAAARRVLARAGEGE